MKNITQSKPATARDDGEDIDALIAEMQSTGKIDWDAVMAEQDAALAEMAARERKMDQWLQDMATEDPAIMFPETNPPKA